MRNYVKDAHGDKLVTKIADLVAKGYSDLDIVEIMADIGYKNPLSSDGTWSQANIKKIREKLNLISSRELNESAKSKGASGVSPTNKVIVKTYSGSEHQAMMAFQADSAKMAANNYYPTTQFWAPGSYGCGAFLLALFLCLFLIGILVFVYMLIVKPAGVLSVTYELRTAPAGAKTEISANEKICPKCAEQIKRAALVCRYCGHKFA